MTFRIGIQKKKNEEFVTQLSSLSLAKVVCELALLVHGLVSILNCDVQIAMDIKQIYEILLH